MPGFFLPMKNAFIMPANPTVPLSDEDLDEIDALFGHTEARTVAMDHLELRTLPDRPLTFSLRSVFPGNIE